MKRITALFNFAQYFETHVMPVPILEVLILFVVLNRPCWFKKIVDKIYSDEMINKPEDLE